MEAKYQEKKPFELLNIFHDKIVYFFNEFKTKSLEEQKFLDEIRHGLLDYLELSKLGDPRRRISNPPKKESKRKKKIMSSSLEDFL